MVKVLAMLVCTVLPWLAVGQGGGVFGTQHGQIRFRSDAPLEVIEARTDELWGMFDTAKNSFAFRAGIKSFRGFNSPLQQAHFNENYLESDRYTDATFSGKIIEKVDFSTNGLYFVRAKGVLDLHGVKRERIIRCTVKVEGGKMLVNARFQVLLEDHDIDVPRIIRQKIATEITVEVDAELINQKP